MLDGRAESTLCGVADLYIVDFGGGEQERACCEAERQAERRRLADRYARYLVASAEVGQAAARRVITALFDPRDVDGTSEWIVGIGCEAHLLVADDVTWDRCERLTSQQFTLIGVREQP